MLHLFQILLKYVLILTLVRLLSTAVGLEFGVSRHYLRLLDFLFKKRIEEKFRSASELETEEGPNLDEREAEAFDEDKKKAKKPLPTLLWSASSPSTGASNEASMPVAPLGGPTIGVKQTKALRRSPSTPDGPPIFLLDDEDFEEDEDLEEKDKQDQHSLQVSNWKLGPDNNELKNNKNKINNNGHDNDFLYMKIEQQQQHQHNHSFQLHDVCKFVHKGLEAIVDDQVTKRFTQEQLKCWNLLTRTTTTNFHYYQNHHHFCKSRLLAFYWLIGFLFRYLFLFPLRIVFTLTGYIWLMLSVFLISLLPMRMKLIRDVGYYLTSKMAFRMLSCGYTSRLEFHNTQYRPEKGDICVSNHTSPLDVVLLACDNCYALVGQKHSGILGFLEKLLSRATNHVWFDRSEMKDRQLVTQRLRDHIKGRDNWPVLIFPEGTCINNSAVMLFRKGSFEISDRIRPIAMKYDPRFGDPFWNSSKHSYTHYLLLLMSSWAIKCDVWYLAPMDRLPGECAAEFASRVKAAIARQAGLEDLNWDGQLKRQATKERWREQQQEDFAKRLKLD